MVLGQVDSGDHVSILVHNNYIVVLKCLSKESFLVTVLSWTL